MFDYPVEHSGPLHLVLTAKWGIRSHPSGNLHIKNVCIRNCLFVCLQKETLIVGFLMLALEK